MIFPKLANRCRLFTSVAPASIAVQYRVNCKGIGREVKASMNRMNNIVQIHLINKHGHRLGGLNVIIVIQCFLHILQKQWWLQENYVFLWKKITLVTVRIQIITICKNICFLSWRIHFNYSKTIKYKKALQHNTAAYRMLQTGPDQSNFLIDCWLL